MVDLVAEQSAANGHAPAGPPLPFAFARRFGVVAASAPQPDGVLEVACRAQPSLATLAEIKRVTRRRLRTTLVPEAEFEELLTAVYMRDASEAKQMVADIGEHFDLASLAESVPETEDLLDQRDDAPIVRLINAVLAEAIREGASDVHLETFERHLQVRFRIDGVMREVVQPKRALAPLLVSRLKVMAKMDIAEKRIPQDGRMALRIGGREVDVRVFHAAHRQRRARGAAAARQAGPAPLELHQPRHGCRQTLAQGCATSSPSPHGIFLVTGPTGSGKTTTLYAAMGELNRDSINILTIENPIEYMHRRHRPNAGERQSRT